jgi:hypothetical protein
MTRWIITQGRGEEITLTNPDTGEWREYNENSVVWEVLAMALDIYNETLRPDVGQFLFDSYPNEEIRKGK